MGGQHSLVGRSSWVSMHGGRLSNRIGRRLNDGAVIGKYSVHSELLVALRLVAILETNKLKPLSFSFVRSR